MGTVCGIIETEIPGPQPGPMSSEVQGCAPGFHGPAGHTVTPKALGRKLSHHLQAPRGPVYHVPVRATGFYLPVISSYLKNTQSL